MTDSPNLDAMVQTKKDAFLIFQEKVKGTNINEQTLLATDYLNHFNEIVMTLEMVPDMPELLEEAKEWKPKTYPEHFRDSTFSDKELAIEAYKYVPARYRGPFEKTIVQMSRLVATTISRMERELNDNNDELLRVTATAASRLIQRLIDHASAIIHGSEHTMDQAEIDSLLGL